MRVNANALHCPTQHSCWVGPLMDTKRQQCPAVKKTGNKDRQEKLIKNRKTRKSKDSNIIVWILEQNNEWMKRIYCRKKQKQKKTQDNTKYHKITKIMSRGFDLRKNLVKLLMNWYTENRHRSDAKVGSCKLYPLPRNVGFNLLTYRKRRVR